MSTSDIDIVTEQLGKASVHSKSELSFAGKGLKLDSEVDAGEITQEIDSCGCMTTLRLEGNTLGVEAAKAIGGSIAEHPEFERALWSDMFTGRSKAEIPPALRHLGAGIMSAEATLTELDLSDNAFGPNGMEGLTDLLKSSSCYRLRTLKLNNNGLGTHGGKMLADCLLQCHRSGLRAGTPLQLRVFVSGRGRLEDVGAAALAETFKVMGSLEEVSMPQNGITHVGITALAEAFTHNPNLRVININDNTFTEVGARSMAKALPQLKKLEEINFGDCLILNGGAEALAEGLIKGHQCLKHLVLSFNDITQSGATAIVRAMEGKPSLERLDLDGNHFGEEGIANLNALMEDMGKRDQLASFSEDDGVPSDSDEDSCENEDGDKQLPLDSSDIGSLADQLAQTTVDANTELNFAGCGLKLNSQAEAEEITQQIDSCASLIALRLEGNTLGVEAAKAIGESLARHPEFKRALWSDMFTGRLKSEIPDALRHLGAGIMSAEATLTELDLSDNAFGPNGMEGLTDLLKSSSCYRLRTLKLNNNGLGIHGGKMLARCLLECHKAGLRAGTPLQLRTFVSGRGRLENDGAKALAEAFKVMGSLEEVSMPQNGITHHGITALAEAFAQNTSLRVLNMNDNTFTEAGARSMAEALHHLHKLEEINFGDCLVRNGGAELLAGALSKGHKCLKRLTLSFNEIRESGANAIAYAVVDKPSLEKLDLDGNQLGEDGIEVIRATMESIGLLDRLASFSDDEGLDSDNDGEEDDDVDQEDEDDDDDDERETSRDNERVNDLWSQSPNQTPHQEKHITTKDFLLFPSPSKLKALGSHCVHDIVSYVQEDTSDVDRAIDVFMKVSCIVVPEDEQTSKAACDCADAIFRTLFRSSDPFLPGLVANSILVHLGLIKSEDKKFRPVSRPDGVLLVLAHAVKQDYFVRSVRDILQTFLARPHPALIDCHRSRQHLLKALK